MFVTPGMNWLGAYLLLLLFLAAFAWQFLFQRRPGTDRPRIRRPRLLLLAVVALVQFVYQAGVICQGDLLAFLGVLARSAVPLPGQ